MKIFPAIDIYAGAAVRLFKGDYNQMTVYEKNPLSVAEKFEEAGAEYLHTVDLEGAKTGLTPNIETIKNIVENTSLFVELGGGIRSMETIEKYLSIGVNRVILGTAAITDENLVDNAVKNFAEKIAVGVDIKDGFVAIKGWTEKSQYAFTDFCKKMQDKGVKTLICTDISKDGAMRGTNRELYRTLSEQLSIDIIASGGVSSIEDIKALRSMNLYGAIIGKAYYTGTIDLREAIEVAR
jgi:phosphoribosylformimino-5-aminoimidazole carboxamide ribotide isomerase